MAEHILGLLFVTSSSRGRQVFRYPPDPASPNTRLAQPIYSAATYTATEPDTDFRGDVAAARRKLFGPALVPNSASGDGSAFTLRSAGGATAIAGSSKGKDGSSSYSKSKYKRDGKGRGRDDLQARYMNYRTTSSSYEDDSEAGASSSEYDSDFDFEWNPSAAGGIPVSVLGGGTQRQTQTKTKRNDSDATNTGGLRSLEASTIVDNSRRGSASTTIDHNNSHPSDKNVNGETTTNQSTAVENNGTVEDEFMEMQYNYALDYPLSFLSDMLTPPRAACNRKFEINVDSLVFIGHPVCCGPDGKWEAPPEEDEVEDRGQSRGRRMRDGQSQTQTQLQNSLGTLHEGKASTTISLPDIQLQQSESQQKFKGRDEIPSLNMFHLVLIIDKPDPRPGQGQESNDDHHSQTLGLYDEIYREIAFKWTAAAYKLQCESNFIAKQAWEMARFKERCLSDGVPIIDCCRELSQLSALNRSLDILYLNIHTMRQRPANPLYSYLPTTISTTLLDMTINMVLSPRLVDSGEEWAHWGELEEIPDSESDSSDSEGQWEDPTCPVKRPELKVEPWQTLLLVDDDAFDNANEISLAVLGLGLGLEDTPAPSQQAGGAGERRGSRATVITTAEEDETALMKALIEACDVTKPLVEIAHALRFDLEGIVIPLARELVQSKKAIIIEVLNTRLRTIVMPTTVEEHISSIDQYTLRFTHEFPSLPPFPQFISSISHSPTPFRSLLPEDADQTTRQTYMTALAWLLKQDLVVQVHVRTRIFARREIKVEAWKRLWKRKREAWLRKKAEEEARQLAVNTGTNTNTDSGGGAGEELGLSPNGDEMITPRAIAHISNPIDTLNTATGTVASPKNSISTQVQIQNMNFDPELEMYSDDEDAPDRDGDGAGVGGGNSGFVWNFNEENDEPDRIDIPKFKSSFIFKPSRAQKDEARWIKVIRENADELWASKFDLCVQYLDGVTTFEEISYRTGLPRKELEKLFTLYEDDLVKVLHP